MNGKVQVIQGVVWLVGWLNLFHAEVGGEGDYIPIATDTHHLNDFCIKVGNDESHFKVS